VGGDGGESGGVGGGGGESGGAGGGGEGAVNAWDETTGVVTEVTFWPSWAERSAADVLLSCAAEL